MKGVLTILAGLLALTMGASGAWADGSIKDGPVAETRTCGSGVFNGWYFGAAVGGGEHDFEFENDLGGSGDGDDSSVTFGGYSGYNIQCGRLLIGYESDFNYFDTDATWIDPDPCCGNRLTSEINWFSTLRGRLGFVHHENWLFYVTGGLAYADVEHTFSATVPAFRGNDSGTEYGWTAGGGIEFAHDSRWSLRAEALYIDLGEETESYTDNFCGVVCTARIGWDDEFWVGRVGLTYRFGRREEAVPLK